MENQKNNKWSYILIIFLVIVILALGGFIVYDKIIKNNNKDIVKEEEKVEDINYNDFKVIEDSKNSKMHLVKKTDEKYKVVYSFDFYNEVLGFYDNKFYYADENIKYIDLTKKDYKENILFKIPQPECSEGEYCSSISMSKGIILDGTLYFNLSSFAGGNDKYDGLLAINLNAKDFSETKQLINDVEIGEWYFDNQKENIYYAKFNAGNGIIPSKFNLATGKKENLLDRGVEGMHYSNGKILYYYYVSDLFDGNKIVYSCNCTPHNELYLLDSNTKQSTLISKSFYNEGRVITNTAHLIDENIYYSTTEGKIMKHNINTGQVTEYYSVSNFSNYFSFYPVSNDTFIVNYQGSQDIYISNGIVIDSLEKIEVLMTDNTISYFTIRDFK